MQIVRTPDSRFQNLEGYPFAPNYLDIPFQGRTLRMHYLDEGDPDADETVLLVHGEPSWSYLYRKVIPPLVAAGHRVIAPDLIGFGRSDKPTKLDDYTYSRQEDWLRTAMFDILGLRDVTLYAQDWGGLISLRIVAFQPEYFRRVMIGNTGLPVGGKDSNFVPGDGPRKPIALFGAKAWQAFARNVPNFPVGRMARALSSESTLTKAIVAGYEAPFPDNSYKAGVRAMPQNIPLDPATADSKRNREAWARLGNFDKPFRTAFSDKDPSGKFSPTDTYFQRHVKGAKGQDHVTIYNAGHFLQEDQGENVAAELLRFIDES